MKEKTANIVSLLAVIFAATGQLEKAAVLAGMSSDAAVSVQTLAGVVGAVVTAATEPVVKLGKFFGGLFK